MGDQTLKDPPNGTTGAESKTIIDISRISRRTIFGALAGVPAWLPWTIVVAVLADVAVAVDRWLLDRPSFYGTLNLTSLALFVPIGLIGAWLSFRLSRRPRPVTLVFDAEGVAVRLSDGRELEESWHDPHLRVGLGIVENRAGRRLALLAGAAWSPLVTGNIVVLPPETVEPLRRAAVEAGASASPIPLGKSVLGWKVVDGVTLLGADEKGAATIQ